MKKKKVLHSTEEDTSQKSVFSLPPYYFLISYALNFLLHISAACVLHFTRTVSFTSPDSSNVCNCIIEGNNFTYLY